MTKTETESVQKDSPSIKKMPGKPALICLLLSIAFFNITEGQGFVLIRSTPPGASLEIVNQAGTYTTPFQKLMEPGTYSFTLSFEKYKDYHGSFIIETNQTTVIDAVMSPNYGDLKLISEPAGAVIHLDGRQLESATPAIIPELSSGVHRIKLSLPMYKEIEDTITVKDTCLTERFYELAPAFGIVGIAADEGTFVYLDGEYVGNGNYFGRLKEGRYSFTFKKEKHYTQKHEINLVSGDEVKIDIGMQPITGTVTVICDPPETDIYIDDEFLGRSPKVIKGIFSGIHTVLLKKEGYRPVIDTITVLEDKTTVVNEILVEGGVKPTFHSNPQGARVYLNNELIGETPVSRIIKPGEYFIKLEKSTFLPLEEKISIKTDTEFRFELDRAFKNFTVTTYPKKIEMFCKGLPLIPDNENRLILEEGEHNIKFQKNKFITDSLLLNVTPETNELKFILYPEIYRKKVPALMLSLLFPGSGQTYLSRGEKASALWSFVGYGLLGGAYAEYQSAQKLRNEAATTTNEINQNDLLSDAQKKEEYALYMLYGAGAVWGMNFTITLFSRSEKNKYKRMSIKYGINPITGTAQTGFSMNF